MGVSDDVDADAGVSVDDGEGVESGTAPEVPVWGRNGLVVALDEAGTVTAGKSMPPVAAHLAVRKAQAAAMRSCCVFPDCLLAHHIRQTILYAPTVEILAYEKGFESSG
jgi:hypothetical protein